MRYPLTFLDDLTILLKVFQLPEKALIYDPNHVIVENYINEFQFIDQLSQLELNAPLFVNLSNEKINIEALNSSEFILDFKSRIQNSADFYSETFYFINSPDGTVRWVFPKDLKHPGFLSLYNSSGLKASVFQQVVKLAFQTQTQHLMCSGKFTLYSKKEKFVQRLYAGEIHNFSIFTGTVGPNRKAIIALHKEKETTHFIKLPLTENAKVLIDNEWNHLRCLGPFHFDNIEVPKVSQLTEGIKLSNIKPTTSLHNSVLQNIHFSAVTELYDQTTQYRSLCNIPAWNQALDDIYFLLTNYEGESGPFDKKVREVIGKMYEFSQQIDENLELPIAYSHGDFTPWNMYLKKDKIFLYDWELASVHRPILFDLFHFVFQSQVLIKRSSFKVIGEVIEKMRRHPSVRKLIGKYDIDFELHYYLYLLINCSYNIKLFVNQKRLHKQAFWLMDCWKDAFRELSVQKMMLIQS